MHIDKKGVIVDTSRDFNSQTVNFLMGEGVNISLPTYEDYAQVLIRLGGELDNRQLLSDIIGNRPVSDNALLQQGIALLSNEARLTYEHPWDKLRARNVLSLSRYEDNVLCGALIYLGQVRGRVVWLFIKGRAQTVTECAELDANAMAKVFADHQDWSFPDVNVGQLAVRTLRQEIEIEVSRKREKLLNLEKGLALVDTVLERDQSVSFHHNIWHPGV